MTATANRQWTVRSGRVSLRVHRRTAVVAAALVVLCLGAVLASLLSGQYEISVPGVFRALGGHGTLQQRYFVNDVRLPRVLVALLVGAALAVSGAIFQSLSANPLGSPDIVGFNSGATAGALICLVLLHDSGLLATGIGAVGGGGAVAVLVYLLAYRGGVGGYRLILVGVGINALLGAGIAYLLSRAELNDSLNAQIWLVGSLNGRGWDQVRILLVVLAVVLPVAFSLSRALLTLEIGEEPAISLGMSVGSVRRWAVVVSVVLSAAAIVCAGPISFVALAAPQAAKRLARSAGPSLVVSALTGAGLLALADLLAQRLIAGVQLPVGVTTLVLGGLYLGWLLVGEVRKGRT
ncbi:iron chelate uptake ABC transporter family permease subunit [Amycolatopsis rubida]|uniref:Iron chelate uptake ABC transporter family permease subunit n=1 Tax=Amycolatopsis rubida TaxID=112413 RepID=A0ABX0BH29_9PSEU|nr:iron chelate uptake ABC transporter family permease subunit [Amycolatopsis sp. M39]MYW89600.1 iron chelate uptake ABC transporter family permease subunit [Amycolatopsis rubida]NEC54577.1 iron chelate uptake ABC transporter family permease subunit [Amycolatopsis rubida]OAP20637.1 Ferric enterobactin transport system permease protein FepG [Amycolatopsis sp. M39]